MNVGQFEFLSTNYARRIIYNSKIIFGIPFLAFAILAFYGILSKEREDGTINLLKTQPINYIKLIISKLISMNLISIIYFSSFLIFLALICFAQGINLGGFREIYRIFYDGTVPKYFKAYELIPLILLSFIVIMNLVYSLIILVNSLFSFKQTSLAVLISIFGLGYTFTENIYSLKTVFNPIYAIDHVRSLKGKVNYIITDSGDRIFKNLESNSLIYLLIFFVISVLFISISILMLQKSMRNFNTQNILKISKYSIFKFELRKIVNNQSFTIYLLATLILIFSLHFFEVKNAVEIRKKMIGEDGQISFYKELLLKEEKELQNSKRIEDIDLRKEDVEEYKRIIKNYENLIEGYNTNNSEKFYNSQLNEDIYQFSNRSIRNFNDQIIKTPLTMYENIMINKNSIKNKVSPIVKSDFIFSQYQNFESDLIERENRENERYG
ncbi:ABC transporter permease subunit, partial [Helcococcus bovis]|uniref:hypothetical protein n=1 Tax=Helcococcus bovis TaxID=3153252 RepID=UPI0038BA254D